MYKEYLLKLINKTPVLVEGINISKYSKLRDKIEKLTEDEAKELLSENALKTAGFVGIAIAAGLFSLYVQIKEEEMQSDKMFRACISRCIQSYGTKLLSAKEQAIRTNGESKYKQDPSYRHYLRQYKESKEKCVEQYRDRKAKIKEREKEIKDRAIKITNKKEGK